LFVTLLAALLAAPLAATILTVGEDAAYETIDDALDEAVPGDTVSVSAGIYDVSEGVTINTRDLLLQGAGPEQTILDGAGDAYAVIRVRAPGVRIDGFTLRNGSSHGIAVSDTGSVHASNNLITANGDRGVLLGMGMPWGVFTNNTFVLNKVSAVYSYRDEPKTKFINNIFARNHRGIVTDYDSNRITFRYNCLWGHRGYGNTTAADTQWAAKGKGNFVADPRFVDSLADFHLLPGSPCLARGEGGKNVGALGAGEAKPAPSPTAPAQRADFKLVIFSKSGGFGRKLLSAIQKLGYTNPSNHTSSDPNPDASIKYGPRAKAFIDEVLQKVSEFYDGTVERKAIFSDTDTDIFLNLP
jgi:hypothetical protein